MMYSAHYFPYYAILHSPYEIFTWQVELLSCVQYSIMNNVPNCIVTLLGRSICELWIMGYIMIAIRV